MATRTRWNLQERELVAREFVRLREQFPKDTNLALFNKAQHVFPTQRQRHVYSIGQVSDWLYPLVEKMKDVKAEPMPEDGKVLSEPKKWIACGAQSEEAEASFPPKAEATADQVLDLIEQQAQREELIKSLTLTEIASVFASLAEQALLARMLAAAPDAARAAGGLSPAGGAVLVTGTVTKEQAERIAKEHVAKTVAPVAPTKPPKILVVGLSAEQRNQLQDRAGTRYDLTCMRGDEQVDHQKAQTYDHVIICHGWVPVPNEVQEALRSHYGGKVTLHTGDFKSLVERMRVIRQAQGGVQ